MAHVHEAKNAAKAEEYRQVGTEMLEAKDYFLALQNFNKSLCYAPPESELIALLYGRRSAVYMELEEYNLSLENIALACSSGYPKSKLEKLMKRKKRCTELKKLQPRQLPQPSNDETLNLSKLTYQARKAYPSIAKCLDLQSIQGRGRRIVTKRELKPGDVIAIEEAPFRALTQENYFKRCANCLKANDLSLIPHPTCAYAMFCSKKCLEWGHDKYMCTVDEDLSIVARITLETVALFDGDLSKLKPLMKNEELSRQSVFEADLSNSNDPNYKYRQLLAFNSLPVYPHRCDMQFKYHPILNRWSQPTDKVIVEKFMNHVARRVSYAFCSSNQKKEAVGTTGKNLYQDFFVSLFAPFLDHSCLPNAREVFIHNKLFLVVLHPIMRGDLVTISYGPLIDEEVETRREILLKNFGHQCHCIPCAMNWTTASLPFVDQTFQLPKVREKSLKVIKADFKRNSDYIDDNFGNSPCREIAASTLINIMLLDLFACKTQKLIRIPGEE